MKTLDEMKEEFLQSKQVKVIGRKKKPKYKTEDLITYYSIHETEKVL